MLNDAPVPVPGADRAAVLPLTALLLEAVRELCSAEAASLLMRQEDGSLVLEIADGAVADHVRRRRLPPGEGIAGRVLSTGRAEIALPPFCGIASELYERTGFRTRALVAVPLFDPAGAPLGVVEAVNPSGRAAFDEADLQRLAGAALPIAAALAAIAAMHADRAAMTRFYGAVLDVTSARAAALRARNESLQATRAAFELTTAARSSDDKMAGLARMAAGVAHEINNPLAVVLSSAKSLDVATHELSAAARGALTSLLGGRVDAAQKLLTMLCDEGPVTDVEQIGRDMHHGLERIAGIVSRLMVFGDQNPGRIERIDLAAEGRRIVDLLRIHGRGREDPPPLLVRALDVKPVRACRAKIQQVLVEVVDNALRAAARSAAAEGGKVDVDVFDDAREVHVRVVDNGPGIQVDAQGRIFDPFYTSKQEWRAVGLGLSVAWGVVRSLGGRIAVESAPTRGAAITLSFPVDDGRALPPTAPPAREASGRYYEDLR